MPVKSRNLRKKRKCPRWLWHVFTDRPLPPEDPEFNSFQEFIRPSEWLEHKAEVLAYWLNKKTKPGEKKAILLQNEDLLSDEEYKLLGIKKEKFRG